MTDEKIKIEMTLDELAEIQHQIWCIWMQHIFKCGHFISNNLRLNQKMIFCIESLAIEHWQRQMQTDYKDLSEDEKESDRQIVKKFLLKK